MSLRFAPPPRFPLYGLDSPDITQRALDWVNVYTRDGRSTTYGIWLVHLTLNGGMRVGSFDPSVLAVMDDSPMAAAAQHGTSALVDLTLPTNDRSIAPILAARVRAKKLPNENWNNLTLVVEGKNTPGRTWSFAGGWMCVADLGHTCLSAVGIGAAPKKLALRRLSATSAYGFDYDAPIDRMHHNGEHRVWHESLLAPPNTDLHDDHRRVLDQQD